MSQSGKINKLTGRISFYDFEFYLLVRDDGVITFVVTQQPTNNNWHRNGRRGRNDIKTIGRAKAFSFSMPLMPSTFDFFFSWWRGNRQIGIASVCVFVCENVSTGDNDRNHRVS